MVFVRNFDTMNSYYNRSKVNALSNKCIVTNVNIQQFKILSRGSSFEKKKFFTLYY
jgi:hypothetical protein